MESIKRRNSSIELLKLVACFLIILSSALPYGESYGGGYDDVYINLNYTEFSYSNILLTFFRWCGQVGDDLFVVCSAWFLCESRSIKPNKVFKMIADSCVLSILGLIIAVSVGFIPSSKEIFMSFFPVTFRLNWFVGCYIIYYLIHPFVNRAVDNLEQKHFKFMIVILFVAYSILGTLSSGSLYYSSPLVIFICIHLFVLYIKKYNIFEQLTDAQCLRNIILCLLFILTWIVMINYVGSFFEPLSDKNLLFYNYWNPIIILLSLYLLCVAQRKSFYTGVINAISSKSLLIYLIHANYFWLKYGKYELYSQLQKITAVKNMPYIYTILFVIFLYCCFSLFLATIYENTIGKITSFISAHISERMRYHLIDS